DRSLRRCSVRSLVQTALRTSNKKSSREVCNRPRSNVLLDEGCRSRPPVGCTIVNSRLKRMNALAELPGRAKRLKAATHEAHERLDKWIMAAAPFSGRERYGLFAQVQRQFHRDIDALYAEPRLDALLPDLAGRRRLPLIEADLADLAL